MSRRSSKYHRSVCTLWRALGKRDQYGEVTYSQPIFVMCQFQMGGATKYTSDRGREFQHKSTIWTEMRDKEGELVDAPQYDDLIAIGEIHSSEPENAFSVRTIEQYDVALFDDVPDYKIMTE